ncbi:hypothetical protein LCGC14_2486710 [marine sediment metagenome]|uniref:Uncharacterized protein n=1 Tax=marine sediment metagenome TaxID=412755 RepID=A0A0F9DHW0_9ZZZZ
MGRGSVRAGAPVTGTQAAAGTDNSLTDPRIITFNPGVRPCLVRLAAAVQATTAPVLVKVNVEVNGVVSDDFDTGTAAHYALSAITTTIDVSEGGQVSVRSISIATQHNDDDLDDVMVAGYEP